ncbi:hypothetical protein F25303_9565 [Fusarium sp. NRRL 25303]|nr:hypothetical protein F25303_9565 [Fusarium sp. NRRL 25303]
MDERTKKQAADFLARRDVRGDEESQDPDQRKSQSRTEPQPTTATGNPDLAEHLRAEPKSEAIPKLKLTSGNLAMLNQQSSTKASKKGNREVQVFLPPPPDPIVQQDDWVLKRYPSLARISKKGCSADVAFAALRAMGDCD